jgi:hypothetical protein
MSTTVRSGAIYGIGTYGAVRYGVSNVAYTPDGVSASAVNDNNVVIIGDAVSVVVGVTSTGAVGGVGVVGVAVTNVVGVEATAILGEASQRTVNRVEITGFDSTGAIGSVVVVADANTVPDGVTSNALINNVVIRAASNVIIAGVVSNTTVNDNVTFKLDCEFDVNGVAGVGLIGILSITTTSFDYDAVRDLYDRTRTVFVERGTTSAERTVLIEAVPRQIYVESELDRTVFVESESRFVYVESRPSREIVVN